MLINTYSTDKFPVLVLSSINSYIKRTFTRRLSHSWLSFSMASFNRLICVSMRPLVVCSSSSFVSSSLIFNSRRWCCAVDTFSPKGLEIRNIEITLNTFSWHTQNNITLIALIGYLVVAKYLFRKINCSIHRKQRSIDRERVVKWGSIISTE